MTHAAIFYELVNPLNYLENEQHNLIKHEYVNGIIYAMAGANEVHNLLAGNIFFHLFAHLRGKACKVFMSDMKVQIKTLNTECYYYPDILVSCHSTDNHGYYKTKPILIVEILSASTARIGRTEKFYHYKTLDNLQEYILVAQDTRRVEVYARANNWQPTVHTDKITIHTLNLTLSLIEIYERIEGI